MVVLAVAILVLVLYPLGKVAIEVVARLDLQLELGDGPQRDLKAEPRPEIVASLAPADVPAEPGADGLAVIGPHVHAKPSVGGREHERSAASGQVVKGGEVAAEAHPESPVVMQFVPSVEVDAAGQPLAGEVPVVPDVEVEPGAAGEPVGVELLVTDVGAGLDAVVAPHEAEVVGLKVGRLGVHVRLAAEGTTRLLKVKRALPAGVALLLLSSATDSESAVEAVGVFPPLDVQVASTDVGRFKAAAVDCGELGSGGGVGEQVLLHAADEVVGDRLDLDVAAQRVDAACLSAGDALVDARFLPAGDGVEQAKGRAPGGLSRDLDGTEDGGVVGTVHLVAVFGQVKARGRPANAPRVE